MNIFARIMVRDFESYAKLIKETNINVKDEEGSSLLRVAVAFGSEKIALDLIARGIDIDQQDRKGSTELHNAFLSGFLILAAELIDLGADLKHRDSYGNDALWYAATHPKRNLEIVQMILQRGGNPMVKNNAGRSVYDAARERNDTALLELLGSSDENYGANRP